MTTSHDHSRHSQVRVLSDEAKRALHALAVAIGPWDEAAPDFDLRQRIYRACIEVGEVAWAHAIRTSERMTVVLVKHSDMVDDVDEEPS
jgi:hypothetical protein